MAARLHPQHAEIVAAIKALPAYYNPKTFFESELRECYSDAELVEEFGFSSEGNPVGPKDAVRNVRARCRLRDDVFGWIVEEGERERGA